MALDSLRKSAGGVIGIIFVLLLIASFVIWFPAGWFQGFGSQDLITVGDTKIGPNEYMRAQQDVLRAMSSQAGRSLSLQEARGLGLDSRVMERLIGGAAVDAHARALHLAISDAEILDEIMKDPAFKDASGNFSPALFQQTLQAVGMSEQGYIDSLRERNLRRQILATIGKVADRPAVLVTALNNFDGTVLVIGSRRFCFHPETRSKPSSMARKSRPISAESSWRSPSMVTTMRPRASLNPSESAADLP